MKKVSKLLMAAVALTTMASCSDYDAIGNGNIPEKDADLVGTINVEDEVQTRAGILEKESGRSFVWTEDDNVRVFTLEALTYHNYSLDEGAGTGQGWFTSDDKANLTGDKYAVTEAANVFGVSADSKGDAVLTMTLNDTCKVSTSETSAGYAYKFPIPFWGECAETPRADGKKRLDVSFNALVHYLRVDVNSLPAGTEYIVLTTHGNPYLVEDEVNGGVKDLDHGFQLAAPVASTGAAPAGFTDTNAWWEAKDATTGEYTNAPFITDGKSEALSGTLTTKLIDDKSALAVDKRLVSYDYMVVPIKDILNDDIENDVFYVPIVAGYYESLHVLAVTKLSRYSYRWIGTELKNFKKATFTVGKRSSLTMNLQVFDNVDLNTLNKYIALNNTQAKRNTVINVARLVANDGTLDDPDYSAVELDIVGDGNVELNIAEVEDGYTYGTAAKPLKITDLGTSASVAENTAVINLPEQWERTSGKGSEISVNMPNTKVVLGTTGGANSSTLKYRVFGSANTFVSGLELVLNDPSKITRDETNAAITVKNGIATLDVLEGTTGDVYVYTNGQEEAEISDSLIIKSTAAVDLRIDDALADSIFIKKGAKHMIYTTGSAATKGIVDLDNADQLPYDTFTQSFYTGAGLSNYAWANGYDNGTVYTVAQLQSMGETARTGAPTRTEATPADYAMWDRVELMWLGAKEYKWIGPEVNVQNFTFNGKNKRLMNMYMFTSGDKNKDVIYVDDPHFCCTSCGRPQVAKEVESQLALTGNLGLIRSIKEQGTAKVEKVNLNEVMLTTDAAIDSIGSIIGKVDITGAFTFENNKVGEVKIDVNGNYVGGMIGTVKANAITATNNTVLSTKNDGGYVKSDKAYVGGMIGKAETTDGAARFESNSITMQNDIEATGGYAAGMIGSMKSSDVVVTKVSKVAVKDIISGDSYAAGLIGYLETGADKNASIQTSNVAANNVTAENQFAAGLIGQTNVGGTAKVPSFKVNVAEEISATEGFAGGVIAQAAEGNVEVGVGTTQNNFANTVAAGKLAGSQSVGGILGNNKTDSEVTISTYKNADESVVSSIDVNIADYENTYSGRGSEQHFTTTTDLILYGTIQDLVGLMQDDVTITDAALTVSGALNDAKKKEVLYDLHSDQLHNTTTGEYYWGDTNGYVGYSQNGDYTLNGNVIVGEQQEGYNYYKAY